MKILAEIISQFYVMPFHEIRDKIGNTLKELEVAADN